MKLTPSEKEIVTNQFDSYVKTCCKNELRNIIKSKRQKRREIFSADVRALITDESVDGISFPDFIIKGHEIVIKNEKLLKAMGLLEDRERDLILLLFFMGYKPEDLTEELDVVERTVYNRQNKVLEKLKRLMEDNLDFRKVAKSHIKPLNFDVIVNAATGDPVSMNVVIDHDKPYLRELATKDLYDEFGNAYRYMDETIRCQLENKLIKSVLKFKIQL